MNSNPLVELVKLVVVTLTVIGGGYLTYDYVTVVRPAALAPKTVEKDKRFDEVVLKLQDGKEITRIQMYDSISATVLKSIQEQTNGRK
jgi:hypothetical protein